MPFTNYHPELDDTTLLGRGDHRKLKILLEILQRMGTIGNLELCQLVSLLNSFGACPHEGYLDLAVRCFGYVKKI